MSDRNRILDAQGNLRDGFAARRGDPSPSEHRLSSRRGQWGNLRKLLRTPPRNSATVIDTGDLGKPFPINAQLRFAVADAAGNPVLPWSFVFSDVSGSLNIKVRRGLSSGANVTEDRFTLDGTAGGNVLPFDTMNAQAYAMDLELVNAAADFWIEAIATEVEDIATANKILGWPRATPNFFAASNVLQQVLFARPDRVQFFVCNTSTNSNLILGTTAGVSWGPPPVGTWVLPANTFAQYESPIGGWRGDLFAIWDNVAANGGALVTEGVFF